MDSALTATFTTPHRFSDCVLARLIEVSFASAEGSAASFRDTFYVFAEVYFTFSLEEGLFQRPAFEASAADLLGRALSDAVASGALAPLRFPVRLTVAMILASLAMLRQQVTQGMLVPAEAADLLTTMLFEGLQGLPPFSSECL